MQNARERSVVMIAATRSATTAELRLFVIIGKAEATESLNWHDAAGKKLWVLQ